MEKRKMDNLVDISSTTTKTRVEINGDYSKVILIFQAHSDFFFMSLNQKSYLSPTLWTLRQRLCPSSTSSRGTAFKQP